MAKGSQLFTGANVLEQMDQILKLLGTPVWEQVDLPEIKEVKFENYVVPNVILSLHKEVPNLDDAGCDLLKVCPI